MSALVILFRTARWRPLIWPKHVAVNILYSNVVFTNYSLISLAEDTVGIIRFKICRCTVTQAFTIATVIAENIKCFDINPQEVARTTKIRHAISSVDELAFVTLLCLSAPHPQRWDGYTECNRRNVRDFGRVFLMLNYTDITQNSYIQSWKVTEIMVIEMCGHQGCRRTVRRPWRHTCPMRPPAETW
jgi:hypothetical protein